MDTTAPKYAGLGCLFLMLATLVFILANLQSVSNGILAIEQAIADVCPGYVKQAVAPGYRPAP